MAEDFPELRDGDELQPWHLNIIYAELRRWRKLDAAPPLALSDADAADAGPTLCDMSAQPIYIRLTSTYSGGYSWEEVHVTAGRGLETTGVTGSPSAGSPAFELQSGDTTLTADGTVYQAWPSPASGELVFDGKN